MDHIQPLHRGGAALDLDNLQAICVDCHREKTAGELAAPTHPDVLAWREYARSA